MSRLFILPLFALALSIPHSAGAACTFSLTPAGNYVQALGGSSSFRVTTSAGCNWSAKANDPWITLTGNTAGSVDGSVSYSVAMNTGAASRSGTITAAGITFTITQGGGASTTAPVISQGGIVNAASNRAGSVARGSFFTIYGQNLGPSTYQQASYPIPDTMGGVIVTISQGSTSKRAYLNFVWATQINAIMPSDVPLGDVQVAVSYNGVAGPPATVTVVDTWLGIFSTAGGAGPGIVQDYVSATELPLNKPSAPAKPGQIAIVWATGLGAVTGGDNVPPAGGDMAVPVEVRVGGKLASRLYAGRAPTFAGVDNIYFTVPSDAPSGCSVPVDIKAGSYWSNTVRMAISADGKPCQDAANPFGNVTTTGGKTGVIGLLRVTFTGVLMSILPPFDLAFDLGVGAFAETKAGGELAFSPTMNLPPVGSCASTDQASDLGTVLGSGGANLDPTIARVLDAGSPLAANGIKGTMNLTRLDPAATTAPYLGFLGGSLPIIGANTLPPFLDPGIFTVAGTGGKDVGAFTATVSAPAPFKWTNQANIAGIDRTAGLTVNWEGGGDSQTVVIAGAGTDQKTKVSGAFLCLAAAPAGTFTVPAWALSHLPATGAVIGPADSLGLLGVTALPLANPSRFTASGLDAGLIFQAEVSVISVPVK